MLSEAVQREIHGGIARLRPEGVKEILIQPRVMTDSKAGSVEPHANLMVKRINLAVVLLPEFRVVNAEVVVDMHFAVFCIDADDDSTAAPVQLIVLGDLFALPVELGVGRHRNFPEISVNTPHYIDPCKSYRQNDLFYNINDCFSRIYISIKNGNYPLFAVSCRLWELSY